ncbi:MAG: hypothetical protein HUJ22_10075 [Gracilimonas sp.]|uniref:hypothetical protein n=1 Tax=Gracilimonas sp. TaxID=1974203 RepID=UPI0019A5E63F|nr:hypothetical protein [Gracilimonas sp.]MBD3616907.1 hypothetical protein [Gracilimonas sp.]
MIDITQLTGMQEPEPYRWIYFAPPQFRELSPEHQDQFYFLDAASTDAVYEVVNSVDLLCGDDGWGNKPFSEGCYRTVEHFKMSGDEGGLKKWLYRRGLAFKTEVLLLPVFKTESTPIIMTTWKMVSKYTATFFNGDNLIIVDSSLSWCLYYHHDDILYFARDRSF